MRPCALAILLVASPAAAQVHPRLMVDAAGFDTLRALSHPEGPSDGWTEEQKIAVLALRAVVSAADSTLFHGPDDPWWDDPGSQGFVSNGLVSLGMAWQLTGDVRYRDHALDLLATWAATDHPRWDSGAPQLGLGDLVAGVAVGVDWFWDEMTPAEQDTEIRVLVALSNELRHHPTLDADRPWFFQRGHDWNWTGVTAGGLGLAAIALEGHLSGAEEADRAQWLGEVITVLRGYFDYGFEGGACSEGTLYGNYGTHNSLPVAITLARYGDDEIGIRDRNVARVPDWIAYEQLPYDARRFSLLNDTGDDGGGLQYQIQGFPLLLGIWADDRPSAMKHFFDTFFRAQDWDAYLAGGTPFSPYKSSSYVLVSLLDFPAPEARSNPAADFRGGRRFERGLAAVRTSFHDVGADGRTALGEGGQGTLVLFDSREPPPWAAEDPSFYDGHAQFDVNQFLVYSMGAPLFYDSGYGAWEAEHHNLHSIDGLGPSDLGWNNRAGGIVRFVWAKGNAPALEAGDASATWRDPDGAEPGDLAAWALRHLLVLPRTSGAPYLFLFDDIEVVGGPRDVRWFWHAGPAATDFATDAGAATATSTNGAAAATATVLSPPTPTFTSERWDPGGDGATPDDHFRLTTDLGPRDDADLAVLVDLHPAASAASLAATDLGLPEGTFAWTIADGARTDLVAVRRDDRTGAWTFDAAGHTVETDARVVVLRFSGDLAFSSIDAGGMGGATHVDFDGEVVMSLDVVGDMTFSTEEVAIDADGVGEWDVGPVDPASEYVNGVAIGEDGPDGGPAGDGGPGHHDLDTGCGCRASGAGTASVLALAALLAIPRKRSYPS